MLAALNHPNIATIHGLEQSGDTHYLVMELVRGETLRDRIAREGPVPVEEALNIAKQMAEALEAAHGFTEGAAQFSPDGRWLAYVSDESGRPETYVQPYPGPGGKWLISTEGGTEPIWNRNGRELFYRNGNKMMAVDVAAQPVFSAGTPRTLFERQYSLTPFPQTGARYDVSPDGQRFLMEKQSEQVLTQINVVLNWFEELRRRVPAGAN
jgi:Tol biopolymer transport system component